jgi:hypothetical protein
MSKDEKLMKMLNDSKYLKSLTDIDKMKCQILNELKLPIATKKKYVNDLKNYIFVNEIDDLKVGTFLRSISINDDKYSLNPPCIYCDTKIVDSGMLLLCKRVWTPVMFFHIPMDKTILFRKLKTDEKLIILAMTKE